MADITVNIVEVNETVTVNVNESIVALSQNANQVPFAPAETIWEADAQAAIENVSFDYWKRLRNFVSKVNDSPNLLKNIRLIGTSIAFGKASMANYIGYGIANMLGLSSCEYRTPSTNPQSWAIENYSGPFSIRIKGTTANSPIVYLTNLIGKPFRANEITFYYDTEPDGGNMGVEIDNGAGYVAKADITCNGATSYGNAVTYVLDPTKDFKFKMTPKTGVSYFSGYYIDTGKSGATFTNTSFGGSALAHHAGTEIRSGGATPSGDLGLIETFAPQGKVRPDLLIYSGATNDPVTDFAANLNKAVDLAVANGSSVILIMEPGSNQTAGGSQWNQKRAAFYASAAEYPENVLVLDWDRYMSPDLTFNPDFHNTGNIDDVHPGDYGHGDPHVLAAKYFLGRLNVAFPSPLQKILEFWYAIEQVGTTALVDDIAPRLGGDLVMNQNNIVSESNNNIGVNPGGTGRLLFGYNQNQLPEGISNNYVFFGKGRSAGGMVAIFDTLGTLGWRNKYGSRNDFQFTGEVEFGTYAGNKFTGTYYSMFRLMVDGSGMKMYAPFKPFAVTTAQRNALGTSASQIIYDYTIGDFYGTLADGTWVSLTKSLPSSGTTVNRPTGKAIGFQYFDTDLGKPVWYNGTNWADATGTTV